MISFFIIMERVFFNPWDQVDCIADTNHEPIEENYILTLNKLSSPQKTKQNTDLLSGGKEIDQAGICKPYYMIPVNFPARSKWERIRTDLHIGYTHSTNVSKPLSL